MVRGGAAAATRRGARGARLSAPANPGARGGVGWAEKGRRGGRGEQEKGRRGERNGGQGMRRGGAGAGSASDFGFDSLMISARLFRSRFIGIKHLVLDFDTALSV